MLYFSDTANVIIFAVCPRRWQFIFNEVTAPLCLNGCVAFQDYFFFLVKVKNKPWEEHTSICWVHKRMCWQTFDSERAACGSACVHACMPARFPSIYPPACHLEAGQSRKKDKVGGEKSKHHLYVKAHLSRGGEKKCAEGCNLQKNELQELH